MTNQAGKKDDIEFIISGEDNVSQILKGIINELQGVRNSARQTGRDVGSSLDQIAASSRRAGDGVETVGDTLHNIGKGVINIKSLNKELKETTENSRQAGRELERGFQSGSRAADQAASRVALLKQRIVEVAQASRGMMDAINNGTAGFESFVSDQIRRGAYVGGLATVGFGVTSVNKSVNQEYEFSKLGSVLKSSYYNNGVLNEGAFQKDFADLQKFIQAQGLRKDRETDVMGMIGMATELAKNNMNPAQVKAALPVVSDFAQATGLAPDIAAKYLANKLEVSKMDFTTANFQKIADQFTKTVDMSSLDPRDLLFAEKYTDFGNAIGGVDYAISQAMQVLLSKISVEGETAGTALRTLFIESSNMGISDAARSKVSSEKVGQAIDAIIKEVNSVNAAVDADNTVAVNQKGNEKILRKAAIMNKYMSQLTTDQQLEVGSTIFGKEAASVTTIFANDGYDKLLETIDAIRGSDGITKRYADDRANTSKGDLVALSKAVDEIQGKVGRSLEPTLDAAARQLIAMATEGLFSFDAIKKGVKESADLLERELNPEIADTFVQLSELALDGFQIGVSLTPLATGAGKALLNLLNGDINGAAKEVVLALEATDLKIENLPGELQGLAEAAKNAAIFLAAIAAANTTGKLVENGKNIYDAGKSLAETVRGKEVGGSVSDLLGDDKIIKANVVHVYGDDIEGGLSGGKTGKAGGVGRGAVLTTAGEAAASTTKRALATEAATTAAGIVAALGLSYGVSSIVASATEDVTGVEEERRQNTYAGATFWYEQAHGGNFYGNSAEQTERYHKEMKTVGDMIAGYRNRVSNETLNRISQELWVEAEKNMNDRKQHIFGDNATDVAAYVDRRINGVRNQSDVSEAMTEKKLRRKLAPEWAEQEKLRKHYEGMPAGGMWAVPEPSGREIAALIRELENDPFVKGSYKREMIDNITASRPKSDGVAATIIPSLIAQLNKLNEKPIQVQSTSDLHVLVEDNRAVQVTRGDISTYASRTHDSRTLTPLQSVKMRELRDRM